MTLGKIFWGLGWAPLLSGNAIYSWYANAELSGYWMGAVCILCIGYAIQWFDAHAH